MRSIAEMAAGFCDSERPAGNILEQKDVLAQAIAATRFVAGYMQLTSSPDTIDPDITENTRLSTSEQAIIRPLFWLYVERETALQLEASRGLGVDVFGRSTSEIAQDISALEMEIPHRAFCQPVISIGLDRYTDSGNRIPDDDEKTPIDEAAYPTEL
jgi:hypothetical protein